MEYNFRKIEKDWQQKWKESNVYKVSNDSSRPKCYVLDMFPYPSGTGLHVGHPLGYIASDIYARYKRLKGFNVLHPMGYDSFGLPTEQYALETGQHPAVTTEKNINTFRNQLDNIGFCFDWSREIRTSDPKYYKWTQWIFLQIFNSWYDKKENKARRIEKLVKIFEQEGSSAVNSQQTTDNFFSAEEWNSFDDAKKQEILMEYRLAYSAYGEVNWCEALGTVLANDEVINGVSERGGHPVVKKKMRQWYLRITEYAERLLQGLETVEFTDAMKEMQRNWIGKSEGLEIKFSLTPNPSPQMERGEGVRVFTTRPDTIFGVDFMVLAPEHELVQQITAFQQKKEVEKYLEYVKSRSERERLAEVKQITGVFTGAYAVNPFDGREIPIWISEYVLAGYGTGAIMAVPCGDQRDFNFAKHFGIPITNIIGEHFNDEEANATKEATLTNSDFLNGMLMKDAISVVIDKLEDLDIGKRKINYKMRDAGFSRQRYWGEPFPIIYKAGIAYPVDEKELPVTLPHVENYKSGPEGQGPLANIPEWYLIPNPSSLNPNPSPQVEKGTGTALAPKYSVSTPMQYELAKRMRKEFTEAEDKLWQLLRNNQLGVKFRRQHPIDAYIADFISLQNRLIIEVDGGYHETEEQKLYDENRTKILKEIGFDVVRFSNNEVLENAFKVRDKIKELVTASPLSTRGEGLGVRDTRGEGLGVRETNTMPGYAGSSWYFLRYMDPHNDKEFASKKVMDYWNQVDVYVGGTEHAVGHLLYSRMWTKVLFDLGLISFDEPFRKLVNQGMIQGMSQLIYRYTQNEDSILMGDTIPFCDIDIKSLLSLTDKSIVGIMARGDLPEFYFSFDAIPKGEESKFVPLHIHIDYVENSELNVEKLVRNEEKFKKALFRCKGGFYLGDKWFDDEKDLSKPFIFKTSSAPEKMSKRYFNVVNPDDIISKYGADTFRMYEMFLGPVEASKPWDTKGIEGVHRFLKKLWRLFYDDVKGKIWNEEKATDAELKVLHKTIKKIEEDTERFSYNTAVSAFMVCVNELHDFKSHKREILEPLLILLAPYAPHIAEELYHQLNSLSIGEGRGEVSILDASFPIFDPKYLIESSKEYPISINGKMRTTINISLNATQDDVEKIVLENEVIKKWIEGKSIKKLIYVKNKMVNVVV
jgi:leucyl-tRNA synthetase